MAKEKAEQLTQEVIEKAEAFSEISAKMEEFEKRADKLASENAALKAKNGKLFDEIDQLFAVRCNRRFTTSFIDRFSSRFFFETFII